MGNGKCAVCCFELPCAQLLIIVLHQFLPGYFFGLSECGGYGNKILRVSSRVLVPKVFPFKAAAELMTSHDVVITS